MHQVTKFVEVRDDLAVIHQRGLRDRGIGEVADQHAVRLLLSADAAA